MGAPVVPPEYAVRSLPSSPVGNLPLTHARPLLPNRSFNRPTALVIADAESGKLFGPHGALAKVRIPGELSVVVVDETTPIPIAPWRPPLTRITVDHGRYAECVLEMVEKLQAGDLHPPNVRVPLQMNLTESIGPAPAQFR